MLDKCKKKYVEISNNRIFNFVNFGFLIIGIIPFITYLILYPKMDSSIVMSWTKDGIPKAILNNNFVLVLASSITFLYALLMISLPNLELKKPVNKIFLKRHNLFTLYTLALMDFFVLAPLYFVFVTYDAYELSFFVVTMVIVTMAFAGIALFANRYFMVYNNTVSLRDNYFISREAGTYLIIISCLLIIYTLYFPVTISFLFICAFIVFGFVIAIWLYGYFKTLSETKNKN